MTKLFSDEIIPLVQTFKDHWINYVASNLLRFDLGNIMNRNYERSEIRFGNPNEVCGSFNIIVKKTGNINFVYYKNIPRQAGKTTALIGYAKLINSNVLYVTPNNNMERFIRNELGNIKKVVICSAINIERHLNHYPWKAILIDDARFSKKSPSLIETLISKTYFNVSSQMNVVFMDA